MSSRDHLFKVLVVGDAAVGKTSLVQRYSQDSFSKHYKSTVGVDFALKVLQWSDSEVVRLQLWDIAGQERFTSMTRLYYRDASACVIMFDVTNATTFSNSQRWKQDLDSKLTLPNGGPVPCLLLANKVWAAAVLIQPLAWEHPYATGVALKSKKKKKIKFFFKKHPGSSLVAWWLRIHHCHCCSSGHCCGTSSVPGSGASTCCRNGQKIIK
uniref:Ras-related protein Rab n=1 Tax=Sus scrofa TaxID=9823 RepID=A0A8D1LSX6_PIG